MTPEEIKQAEHSPGKHAKLQLTLINQLVEMLSNINQHLHDITREIRELQKK